MKMLEDTSDCQHKGDYIPEEDKVDGDCGHSCKLEEVDHDTACTRMVEAHCHVEGPMDAEKKGPPQAGDLSPSPCSRTPEH